MAIHPDPPRIGQNLNVMVDYNLSKCWKNILKLQKMSVNREPLYIKSLSVPLTVPIITIYVCMLLLIEDAVTGGKIDIDMTVNDQSYSFDDEDICIMLGLVGQRCPLYSGRQTLNISQTIPAEAPGVRYNPCSRLM